MCPLRYSLAMIWYPQHNDAHHTLNEVGALRPFGILVEQFAFRCDVWKHACAQHALSVMPCVENKAISMLRAVGLPSLPIFRIQRVTRIPHTHSLARRRRTHHNAARAFQSISVSVSQSVRTFCIVQSFNSEDRHIGTVCFFRWIETTINMALFRVYSNKLPEFQVRTILFLAV